MGVRGSKAACIGAALGLAALLGTPRAAAEGTPTDAAGVKRAGEHFDEGGRAFRGGRFELAASYFEAAFGAMPNPRALRNAIRAREKVGHLDRAATMAALALRLYPDDTETLALANELLARVAPELERYDVRCAVPCVLAIDARGVVGAPSKDRRVYVAPGKVAVSASFPEGQAAAQEVIAVAGGEGELTFGPPPPLEAESPKRVEREPGAVPIALGTEPTEPATADRALAGAHVGALRARSWVRSPGVFYGALAATAALGGVAIWSGIDTVTEPGRDAVREACAGQGSACPEYQLGKSKELRTNLLIGGAAASGLATVLVAAFVTDFAGERARVGVLFAPGGVAGTFGGSF